MVSDSIIPKRVHDIEVFWGGEWGVTPRGDVVRGNPSLVMIWQAFLISTSSHRVSASAGLDFSGMWRTTKFMEARKSNHRIWRAVESLLEAQYWRFE